MFVHVILPRRPKSALDLYFQYSKHESWSLYEGVVKTGSFNIDQGVCLLSVCGEKTAFAYSEDLNLGSIEAAADVVTAIGRQGQNVARTGDFRAQTNRALYTPVDPVAAMADKEKVSILETADKLARSHDERVKDCLLYTSPSPRDQRGSRMPSSA